MSRRRIDLRRLPIWLQYAIALAVVGVVGVSAWLVSGGAPAPAWVMDVLVPVLGWAYIVLVVVAVGAWLRRRDPPS